MNTPSHRASNSRSHWVRRSTRPTTITSVAALLALALALVPAGVRHTAAGLGDLFHGISVARSCAINAGCVPFTPVCAATSIYLDDAADAVLIVEAYDVVDLAGLAIRVPAEGSLPIETVIGNAVVIGPPTPESPLGTFPVLVGPAWSTFESPLFPGFPLPGDDCPGTIVVLSNQFEMSTAHPPQLPVDTFMTWIDQCDSGMPACDYVSEQSSSSYSVIHALTPAVTLDRSASVEDVCEGVPTEVSYDYTLTNAGDVGLDQVVLVDSLCLDVQGPFGDVGGPGNSGDGVLGRAEQYLDFNMNGTWDPGEPHVDRNGNGVWDDDEVWTYTCTTTISQETTGVATVTAHAVGGQADCVASSTAAYTVRAHSCECSAADLDGSGDVGFADLMILLPAWGACPGCAADLDGDGDVDFDDLMVLLASWGPCP